MSLYLSDYTTSRMVSSERRLWWPWHCYSCTYCTRSVWQSGSLYSVQHTEKRNTCKRLWKAGKWWKV